MRRQVDPRQFQVFDCYVTKGWPALRVARELGVSLAQVYVGKHRIGALLQKIVADLERGGGSPGGRVFREVAPADFNTETRRNKEAEEGDRSTRAFARTRRGGG